jgi:hypothetical protein
LNEKNRNHFRTGPRDSRWADMGWSCSHIDRALPACVASLGKPHQVKHPLRPAVGRQRGADCEADGCPSRNARAIPRKEVCFRQDHPDLEGSRRRYGYRHPGSGHCEVRRRFPAAYPRRQEASRGSLLRAVPGLLVLANPRLEDWVRCRFVCPRKGRGRPTYDDLRLPQFEGRDLSGKLVRSSDLLGKPALVVLLSLHCNHSVESLPILARLAEQLRPEGRRVIGVLLNSGDVEDAKYWIPYHHRDYRGQYDVWVVGNTSFGDAVGSHLTPTYLAVDKNGRVRKKLVGFKTDREALAGLKLCRWTRAWDYLSSGR